MAGGTRARTAAIPKHCSRALSAVTIAAMLACAGETTTITVASASMSRSLKATVVLPRSYATGESRYPVIYLLHGYDGDHRTWPGMVPLAAWADKYEVLFVCPDGGSASWYLDSPVNPRSRWETFIIRELIPRIDSTYRTSADAGHRTIAGSSMGGHGAAAFLCTHHDLFRAASCISTPMDLTEYKSEWGISDVLGPLDRNRQTWIAHSAISLLHKLRGTDRLILLDCGQRDWTVESNRRARDLLVRNGIAHRYYERPGDHSRTYIRAHAEEHVAMLAGLMAGRLPPPQ